MHAVVAHLHDAGWQRIIRASLIRSWHGSDATLIAVPLALAAIEVLAEAGWDRPRKRERASRLGRVW